MPLALSLIQFQNPLAGQPEINYQLFQKEGGVTSYDATPENFPFLSQKLTFSLRVPSPKEPKVSFKSVVKGLFTVPEVLVPGTNGAASTFRAGHITEIDGATGKALRSHSFNLSTLFQQGSTKEERREALVWFITHLSNVNVQDMIISSTPIV